MPKVNWNHIIDTIMLILMIFMIVMKIICVYNMLCKKIEFNLLS